MGTEKFEDARKKTFWQLLPGAMVVLFLYAMYTVAEKQDQARAVEAAGALSLTKNLIKKEFGDEYYKVSNKSIADTGIIKDAKLKVDVSREKVGIYIGNRDQIEFFGSAGVQPYNTPSDGTDAKYLHVKYYAQSTSPGFSAKLVESLDKDWDVISINGIEVKNSLDKLSDNDIIDKNAVEEVLNVGWGGSNKVSLISE